MKKREQEMQSSAEVNKMSHVDFRDTHILQNFIDDHGKILSRKRTGLTANSQRKMEQAIKRARYMALLPYIRR